MSNHSEEQHPTSIFASFTRAISDARQAITEEYCRFCECFDNHRKIIQPTRFRSQENFCLRTSSDSGRVNVDKNALGTEATLGGGQSLIEDFDRFWNYFTNKRRIITPTSLRSKAISGAKSSLTEEFNDFWEYLTNKTNIVKPISSDTGRVVVDMDTHSVVCNTEAQAEYISTPDSRKRKAPSKESRTKLLKKAHSTSSTSTALFDTIESLQRNESKPIMTAHSATSSDYSELKTHPPNNGFNTSAPSSPPSSFQLDSAPCQNLDIERTARSPSISEYNQLQTFYSECNEHDKSPITEEIMTGEKSVRRLTLEFEKKPSFRLDSQTRHIRCDKGVGSDERMDKLKEKLNRTKEKFVMPTGSYIPSSTEPLYSSMSEEDAFWNE